MALLITRVTGWLVILGALAAALALIGAIRLGILELRLPFLLWPLALVAFVGACVAVISARSIGVISAALAALVFVWCLGALATRFDGATGTRTIVVTDSGELASRYHVAAGWLTVDLGALSIDEPTRVELENRAGRIDVVVPDDAAVEVRTNVWMGRSAVLGSVVEGWRVDDQVRDVGGGTDAVLTIDLDVGIGEARLCRASDAGTGVRRAHVGDAPGSRRWPRTALLFAGFVPGGRVAAATAYGATGGDASGFWRWAAVGSVLSASYLAAMGEAGRRIIGDEWWAPLPIAAALLVLASLVTVLRTRRTCTA